MNDIKRIITRFIFQHRINKINIQFSRLFYLTSNDCLIYYTCMKIYNYRRWCYSSNNSNNWNNIMIYTLKHTKSVGVIPINY